MEPFNKLFRELFKISKPLDENNFTPQIKDCCYCKKDMRDDRVIDHLNAELVGFSYE